MDRVRVARIVRLRRASDILPYDFMEAPGSDSWADDPDSGDSYDAGFSDARSGEMSKNPEDPAYVAGFRDGAKADRDPSDATLDPFISAKEEEEDEDPCWDDYEQMGMKTKDGKEVPNCIPKSSRVAMPWFADPSKGYTGEYCDADGCYESEVDWQNEEKYHHKGVAATCAISPVQARHIVSDIEEISSNLPFQVARDSKGRYFLRIFDMQSTLLEMYNRIDIAEDNVQSGYADERFEWMGNLRSYRALADKLKSGKFQSYASKENNVAVRKAHVSDMNGKKKSGTWPLSEQDQDDFEFYEEIASEDYGYPLRVEDYTEEAIEAAERAAEKLGLDWPPTSDSARGYQNNYGKYSKKTAAGSEDWYDTNFDDEDSYAPGDVVRTCARCRGTGEIRGIYGEEPCPLCFGEGVMRLGKKKVAAFGVQYIKWTRGTPGETKVKDFPTKEARDKWIAKQEEEGDIEVLSYADSGNGMLASKKTTAGSPLSNQLKALLSDAMSLYFKAHAAHWNVTGSDFSQFHEMFAAIYEDVYDSIDPIAENIRKLDDYAPQDIADLEEMRQITPLSVTSDIPTLVADLLSNNEAYLATLTETFTVANEMNQQGIANFIAERIDSHQKWSWQLRSSLPSPSIAEARRRFR